MFSSIRNQSSDLLQLASSSAQVGRGWEICNLLPIPLKVYKIPYGRTLGCTSILIRVPASSSVRLPASALSHEDQIFAAYPGTNGDIPMMRHYTIRSHERRIHLGAAVYNSLDGHLDTQAAGWDMRGFWINNELPLAFDIYYKGNLIAQVSGNDGKGYHGGSRARVYVDNDREGFLHGDRLLLVPSGKPLGSAGPTRASHGSTGPTGWFDLLLDDYHTQNISIGVITGYRGPDNDQALYRFSDSYGQRHTGVTFYEHFDGHYGARPTRWMA